MKILLLGADGQLGLTLEAELASIGEVVAATRTGARINGEPAYVADLGDATSLIALLDALKPAVLVNAAAYTAVDLAETQALLAFQINATAVGVLSDWASRNDALLVHYSTDYVFDGKSSTPYREDDATEPLGVYGRSKRAGEELLLASTAHYFLLRTAWVYSPHGKNFLLTMLRLGADRSELAVVDDQTGAPTTTGLIARHTATAITAWCRALPENRRALEGTYHVVADGQTTWHGFADAIFSAAVKAGLLVTRPTLKAIATSAYPTPATRPVFSVLATEKFQRTFAVSAPNWSLGLEDTIATLARARKTGAS